MAGRASILYLDDEEERIQRETRRIMAPHLQQMRKEIAGNWPGMEPDLMLLQWLCSRHRMETPNVSLAKRAGQPPPDLFGYEPTPPSGPPPAVTSPIRGRVQGAEAANKQAQYTSEASNGDRESERGDTSTTKDNSFGTQLQKRREDKELPQLRSLVKVNQDIARDCIGTDQQASMFRDNTDSIAMHVANIRMELRGKFLANVPLLSLQVLTKEEQFRLVGKLRPWNFAKGEAIFAQGDIGDKLYIIEGGSVDVWKSFDGVDKWIVKMSKGSFFGEISVMYDMPRSATVKAATEVTALSLSREDLHSMLPPEKIQTLKIMARTQVFNNLPIFRDLDGPIKTVLSAALKEESFGAGETVIREGTCVSGASRRIYILETGKCTVVSRKPEKQDDGDAKKLKRTPSCTSDREFTTIRSGDYVGMLEFVYGCPLLQSMTTVNDVSMLSISYDDTRKLFDDNGFDTELLFSNMERAVHITVLKEVHRKLKSLSDTEFGILLKGARTRTFQQWETMFRQGETLQGLTILRNGRCIEYDGSASTLAELDLDNVDCRELCRPGESFGSRAVITLDPGESFGSKPAPFTVVAVAPTCVLEIPLASFEELVAFQTAQGKS